ncbi:MAG TPA: Clp protease N-terminal domain-containing protein [Candidatus Dormibacteraeota bacterium]|nr:Clp protease N-terminal domain-containing protein [Candidatus Dormibacteraeota bacterium]
MDEIEALTLTPRLRRSLSEAARVARDRGHAFLGTEHVLLGLLAEPDGIAAQVLAQLGVTEQTRLKLEQIMDSPGYFAPPPPPGADLELRGELLRRREADQAPRRKMRPGTPVDRDLWTEMEATQRDNVEWLKQVIADRGWPGRSLVGPDGADAAWLIAQHADHDPDFQRECLVLLEKAAAAGEVSQSNVAYLTDRVMLKETGRQRYGTQFQHGKDGPEPFPLEDPDSVDELRAAAGLMPLAEYCKGFERRS